MICGECGCAVCQMKRQEMKDLGEHTLWDLEYLLNDIRLNLRPQKPTPPEMQSLHSGGWRFKL
jgi:hypothetical protein